MISRQKPRFLTSFVAFLAVSTLGCGFSSIFTIGQAGAATSMTTSSRLLAKSVLAEINSLRVQHGLPAAKSTTAYNSVVRAAAGDNADPSLTQLGIGAVQGFGVWGIAATGSTAIAPDPTSVVKSWVFDDGWQGANTSNLDCTGPTAPGCNGHERAILSAAPISGAQLYVDTVAIPTSWNGNPALSVAAILVWKAPSNLPATSSPVKLAQSVVHVVAKVVTKKAHSIK